MKNEEATTGEETPRKFLLRHGLAFARDVARIPGVRRVALLGSLLTPKPRPKDIDFLLTVSAEADLAPVARLARHLQGLAQGRNLGADVFLADEAGAYLGRTCQWRECRFGIRAACPALNCGERPHLCDDLQAVTLRPDLVTNPPLVLWPAYACCVELPPDVLAAVTAIR